MKRLLDQGIKGRGKGYAFTTTDYDTLQAILLISGSLAMMVGTTTTLLTPGMLVWLPPGSAFTLSCPTGSYRGVFAIARGDDLPRGQAWAAPASPQLSAVAAAMRAPSGGSAEANDHLAWAFLALADRCRPEDGAHDTWAERLRLAIESHLGDQMPVGRLCTGWGISYRQLARRFTAATGCSPKAWQLERRLLRAQAQLADSGHSITDIALDLGFASSQHFASRYRRRFGTNPRAARSRAGPRVS